MKLQTCLLACATALACVTSAAGSAIVSVTNLVSISASALSQGGTNTSHGVSTIASPISTSINTKQILKWLALDEYAESNYVATNFPAGAQLVVIVTADTNADFQVLNKSNLCLVDVSDIMSADHGSNYVYSGKVKDSTGLYFPDITVLKPAKLVYNDLGITPVDGRSVVGVDFYLGGMETKVVTDGLPNSSHVYTQIISVQVGPCAGEGTYKGTPILVNGNFSYGATIKLRD